MMPSRDHTGLPIHFHSSMISRSAARIVLRMLAKVLPRQSVSSAIIRSMRCDAVIGSLRLKVVGAIVPASLQARQDLFKAGKEPRPTGLGAAVGLLLVRSETCLLHAQMGARAGRRERPGDDTLQAIGSPSVGQRLVRLDRRDAA